MERKSTFWMFLALAVAIGIAFESLKSSSSAGPSRFSFLRLDDDKNASIRDVEVRSRVRNQAPNLRLPVVNKATQEAPKLSGLAPATTPPSGAKAEEKKKVEEKTKSKDAKEKDKKKKKKKKTIPGKDEKKDGAPKETEDADEQAHDDSAAEAAGPAPTYFTGVRTDDGNRLPQTLEDWRDYLLAGPDFDRVSRLIKFFQASVVKADVFYTLIDDMLESTDDKMHELAVMALGATPNATSFRYLVAIEKEPTTPSPLKKQINVYLKTYTQLQFMRILASALRQDTDNDVTFEALRLLQVAAETHLRRPASTGQPVELAIPANSSAVRFFGPFINVLGQMAQSAPDGNVRSAAGRTLSNLQNLLGST